jgi:hypothetical protein
MSATSPAPGTSPATPQSVIRKQDRGFVSRDLNEKKEGEKKKKQRENAMGWHYPDDLLSYGRRMSYVTMLGLFIRPGPRMRY